MIICICMGNENCSLTSSASKAEGVAMTKESILEQRRISTAPTAPTNTLTLTNPTKPSHLGRSPVVTSFDELLAKDITDTTGRKLSEVTIGEVTRFLQLANVKLNDGVLRVALGGEDYYLGEVKNGKFEGKGRIVVVSKGVEYEGDWHANMRHGKGVEKWADGKVYKGDFVKDTKEGFGDFSYPDGSSYTGNFHQNLFNGYGIFYRLGKYEYSGNFLNGFKHGKGKINYENGDYYEGEFYRGKRHGKGIFFWADEENVYDGEWFDDQPHGIGYFTQKGKGRMKSLFQDGKRTAFLE